MQIKKSLKLITKIILTLAENCIFPQDNIAHSKKLIKKIGFHGLKALVIS